MAVPPATPATSAPVMSRTQGLTQTCSAVGTPHFRLQRSAWQCFGTNGTPICPTSDPCCNQRRQAPFDHAGQAAAGAATAREETASAEASHTEHESEELFCQQTRGAVQNEHGLFAPRLQVWQIAAPLRIFCFTSASLGAVSTFASCTFLLLQGTCSLHRP